MESPRRNRSSRSRRASRRASPEYLSIEMILRKSFCDSLKEYLKNCSLAGASKISDPNCGKIARIFWTIIFIAALAISGYFLLYIWSDTLTKPLIVTMESATHPISAIDFPAVAVCNINRISKRALAKLALEEYADLAKVHKGTLEDVEKALLNWGRLINYSYNDTIRTDPYTNRIIEKYRSNNLKIVQIMKMLAPSCEEMLVKCTWDGILVDCSSLFQMHRIANRGHCCTFNYWTKRLKTEIKRQREPGHLYGLSVILDPQIQDYAYPLNLMKGFDILVLDPLHFADPSSGRVSYRICQPNTRVYLELKSSKQIASKEVRKYALQTRQCLFQDEENSNLILNYNSYSSCIVHCRIETIYSLCKCTPYFFAIQGMQIGPVCTLEDLRCLNKYREKFLYMYPFNTPSTKGLEWELKNSLFCPNCYPDCELTAYFTKSFEVPIHLDEVYSQKEAIPRSLKDMNTTDKCMLGIYHPLPDATLDRLDVVYYWYEVLSNVGGFCGIIIGFSIINVVEILYFLTIRFVKHFIVNYQKYH